MTDILLFSHHLSAGERSAGLLVGAGIFLFVFLKVYNGQFKAIEQ